MTTQTCTTGSATSDRFSCTPVGATSRDNLAPFFVQHQSPELAPTSVQLTLHPRWFNNEYPYLLTNPDMHYVQVGRFPLPNFTTTHLAQLSHVRNQQTACAEGGVA